MKFLATTLALSLASIACVGSIPGTGNGPQGNGGPGGSNSNGNGNGSGNGNGNGTVPPIPPENMPPVSVGMCNESTLTKPRVWRLTHSQVRNALRDSLGFTPGAIDAFPDEARIDATTSRNGFANRSDELKISPLLADHYFKASEELATEVAGKAANYGVTCAVASLGTGTCLRTFITNFGAKMWRRPLTDAEVNSLNELYGTAAGQGEGPDGGLKTVVQALFLSPNFLYRSELGDNQQAGALTRLTDNELASALSFALWDTAPDATLLDLAKQGRLRDKNVLVDQAKRLMGTVPKASAAMHSFVEQWLHTEDLLTGPPKDLMTFSAGTPEMARDLLSETSRFIDSVLYDQGGDKSFKTLFTANYSFVNARTAALYGVQGVTGDQLVKKDLDPSQRRGLLTHGSFMWGHSNPDGTHPVERGRYFREEILCEGVPDPPPGTIIDPQFGNATLTARERLAIHLKEPACAACHQLIDGLGLAMENFDGIGRYRTEEVVQGGARKPIDPKGTVPLPSDPSTVLSFNNYIELIDQLSSKKDVYSCFASQYLDYSTGRKPGDINDCEKQLINEEFVKSGHKIDTLILGVVNSPSFSARRN